MLRARHNAEVASCRAGHFWKQRCGSYW